MRSGTIDRKFLSLSLSLSIFPSLGFFLLYISVLHIFIILLNTPSHSLPLLRWMHHHVITMLLLFFVYWFCYVVIRIHIPYHVTVCIM